jgi:hypothetical protein
MTSDGLSSSAVRGMGSGPGAEVLLGAGTAQSTTAKLEAALRQGDHVAIVFECDRASEARCLMNSIVEYFASGQRSSATMLSSRSATARTASIAGITVSRMYLAEGGCPHPGIAGVHLLRYG